MKKTLKPVRNRNTQDKHITMHDDEWAAIDGYAESKGITRSAAIQRMTRRCFRLDGQWNARLT